MTMQNKVDNLKALLATIEREYSPAAFANSFGAEDMVLTHLIAREFCGIQVFTLDTGRLPKETIDLMHIVEARYELPVLVYTPLPAAVDEYVRTLGLNAFYEGLEQRKACCRIRKVEPLARALAGKNAWLTGLRREQAPSRRVLVDSEFDPVHGITKFNPLIDWSSDDVWAYLGAHDVPWNALHDRGFPSIGCEPCTRAVRPGEDARAGRWWWEQNAGQKECGLHVQTVDTSGLKLGTPA